MTYGTGKFSSAFVVFFGLILNLRFFLLFFFSQITEVRPKVTLVVRMAASVANYDYIVDWEFQTDGLIKIKVSN